MRNRALALVLGCCVLLSCVGHGAKASRASASLLAVHNKDGDEVDLITADHTSQAISTNAASGLQAALQARITEDDYDDEEDAIDDKSLLLEAARADAASRGEGETVKHASGAGLGKADGEDGGADDDEPSLDRAFCHKNRYRKRTLKVVKEMPFVGLFPELQRTRRFEGSGITYAKGSYWVVFDSLRSLGQLDLRFSFRGPENRLVGPIGEESQFEGIAYDDETDTFVVLRESMDSDEHGLVPVTEELRINERGDSYTMLSRCPVRFPLQDVNKGFESLVVFRRGGRRHMLGLCESNYCKTVQGPDPPGLERGNGRLVWASYKEEDGECSWEVEKVIKLPPDAYLLDYSAISFRGDFGSDVAVVSQEDAAVWVGTFDWEEMEFVAGEEGKPAGRIYHFPRTEDCGMQYCNVEGVSWIDGERLVFASDKAKRIQDYRCMNKDQSVHIMALP